MAVNTEHVKDLPPRYTDEQVITVTRRMVEKGGVITWDVPITAEGLIPEPFLNQLAALTNGLADDGPAT